MSVGVKKILNISVEYGDLYELNIALRKMESDLKMGKTYERMTYHTCILEWSCVRATAMDYSEKIIDGKLCQVFQSKMNKKTR